MYHIFIGKGHSMTSLAKKLKIMFVSHTYIGGPFVVGSHHLARELSEMGHRVLHLSTPVTPAHLLKIKQRTVAERFLQWRRMKTQRGDLIHCVPFSLIPWTFAGRLLRTTGKNWFVKSIAFPRIHKLLDRHQFSDVDLMLIDQPYFAGIEDYVRAKVIIYRPTDNYAEMLGDPTVETAERKMIRKAHGMVATSEPVLAGIRKYEVDIPAMVMENGVEFGHFAGLEDEPEEYKAIPKPRAVYVGAVDKRLDLGAVRTLARARPDLSILIIGPGRSPAGPPSGFPGNVHFLGSKNYASLPAYLHHADVALLPLSDHGANRGRSPMKIYEYAAAGLPIVATETPELLRRGDDFLYFYDTEERFAEKVGQVLEKLGEGEIARESIRNAARKHSWRTKAEQLVEFGCRLDARDPRDSREPQAGRMQGIHVV